VLLEQVAQVGSYADGATSGWRWGGTAENSSSSQITTQTYQASAALSGGSSMSAQGTGVYLTAATLSGVSALGTLAEVGAAALSGTGILTAAPIDVAVAGATLSGGSALSAAGGVTESAAAEALTASSSVTVTAVRALSRIRSPGGRTVPLGRHKLNHLDRTRRCDRETHVIFVPVTSCRAVPSGRCNHQQRHRRSPPWMLA
jgi:hypothetical protein